jgi:hypothetical protein
VPAMAYSFLALLLLHEQSMFDRHKRWQRRSSLCRVTYIAANDRSRCYLCVCHAKLPLLHVSCYIVQATCCSSSLVS